MITLTGNLTIVVDVDRDISEAEVEDALMREAFLTDNLVRREVTATGTQLVIQLNVPMAAITGKGVPYLDAESTLRCLADAIATLNKNG